MAKTTCIIAAYNEAERIGKVLEVASSHPLIDEVIVVDDGSTDATASVVALWPNVQRITYPHNHGKSFAVATGIASSTGEYILLLDADLAGLTQENISSLLEPVLSYRVDVSISLRGNSLPVYLWMGVDFVSGERVFAKKLLKPYISVIKKLPSFGFEVYFNKLIIKKGLRVAIVKWMNVINLQKYSKFGLWNGIKGDVFMIGHIFKVVTVFEMLYQNYKIRSLRDFS